MAWDLEPGYRSPRCQTSQHLLSWDAVELLRARLQTIQSEAWQLQLLLPCQTRSHPGLPAHLQTIRSKAWQL